MKNYNYYDKLTKDYNDSLSVLSGGSSAPVKRKSEHQKEMAAYHNKTSPAANDVTPKQKKSSFEQWNIEKTQPKLSYGIGRYAEPYTPPEVDNAVLKGYNNSA